jgi:hypothetical protein
MVQRSILLVMRIRVTGLNLPWLGVQWEQVPGDREVAQETITFLENRRLLFANFHVEDERHCVQSAIETKSYLTELISKAAPGDNLENSLRAMRAACRKFVEAAGPDARNFYEGRFRHSLLGLALGDLRTLMGVQIALIAKHFDLTVEPELAAILPPEDDGDLAWLPGFGEV